MSFNWNDFNILLVEDDQDMLQVLRYVFSRKGACVHSAMNGQEALKVLENHAIHFVISDVQMPVMDGIELLKKIKSKNPLIPIVLLATGQAEITQESALDMGAIGLIRKPFRTAELLEIVQRALTLS